MHASGQWSALGTLLGGGKVVLYGEPHVDMELVLDLLERERVNACNLVGDASARPMLDALTAQPGRWDLSSLRLLGSGGSILSGDVKDALMAALPSVLAIVEGIGSSESPAQAVAVTTRGGAPSASLTFAAKADTIVVDEATLRPWSAAAAWSGGSRRGAGCRSATTRIPSGARTFVEIDGERWSLPGDMATIDADGTIHLLGRGSMCINTGGEKVYPEEVEAVLKVHPDVADAVVLGAPDERFGQRVVAVDRDATKGGPAPDLEALQAHCRTHLAGYKVPRAPRRARDPAHAGGQGRLRLARTDRRRLNRLPFLGRGIRLLDRRDERVGDAERRAAVVLLAHEVELRGLAAPWHDEQSPPRKFFTCAPELLILVPCGDTPSEKNSQSPVDGL